MQIEPAPLVYLYIKISLVIGYHSITNIVTFSKSKIKMKSLFLFLILKFTIGQLSIVVESKRCGKNENTLTLEVRAEFYQSLSYRLSSTQKLLKLPNLTRKHWHKWPHPHLYLEAMVPFPPTHQYESLKDSVISSEEYGIIFSKYSEK